MRWVKIASGAFILSLVISLYYPCTATQEADTEGIIVPAVLDKPTNVVSELGTLCSEVDQFGLIVKHSVVKDETVLDITKLTFEVNYTKEACHATKETPSYVLDGYFDLNTTDGLYSIGVGPMYSAWTKFDEQLYPTPLGKFVQDLTIIDMRLDYVDAILRNADDYWNGSYVRSAYGTYYTVETPILPQLVSRMSLGTDYINSTKTTIFIPDEVSDSSTYRILYIVFYTDNDVGINAEVFDFELLTGVSYDWNPRITERNTATNTDVFEYIYDYIMR